MTSTPLDPRGIADVTELLCQRDYRRNLLSTPLPGDLHPQRMQEMRTFAEDLVRAYLDRVSLPVPSPSPAPSADNSGRPDRTVLLGDQREHQ